MTMEQHPVGSGPPDRGNGIRRFYAFKLVTETQFTGGIWILYLQSRGLSLAEIGLSEAAFHLAPVLLELPSGSFADLVGRRWSLAIGSILIAMSSALLCFADSLAIAMIALFLHGASYSFRSGADQAYLYDSLGDGHATFGSILGKLMGASYIVSAATIWIGASLSEQSYGWPIGLAVVVGLAGAWLAAGLVEERKIDAPDAERRSPRQHAREAAMALRARPDVVGVLLFSGGFWTALTVAFLYLQAAFSERGLSNGSIGLILAAGLVLTAIGSAAAGRVEYRFRFSRQLSVLAILTGLGVAGTAFGSIGFAVAAYLFANLASGLPGATDVRLVQPAVAIRAAGHLDFGRVVDLLVDDDRGLSAGRLGSRAPGLEPYLPGLWRDSGVADVRPCGPADGCMRADRPSARVFELAGGIVPVASAQNRWASEHSRRRAIR